MLKIYNIIFRGKSSILGVSNHFLEIEFFDIFQPGIAAVILRKTSKSYGYQYFAASSVVTNPGYHFHIFSYLPHISQMTVPSASDVIVGGYGWLWSHMVGYGRIWMDMVAHREVDTTLASTFLPCIVIAPLP